MNKEINIELSCSNCSFAPFCRVEDVHPSSFPINSIVTHQHTLKKNQHLYFSQSLFSSLYAIKSGCLKSYEIDREGNELIRGFYFQGEILGFEAIAKKSYLFSVTALSDAIVCEIPYSQCMILLNDNSSFQQQILYLLSNQLSIGLYLNFANATQRLAAFLLDLTKRLSSHVCPLEFFLPMTRQDIGNYLRLSTETVSRLLSQFKENKLITIEHRKIRFLQFEQLKSLAAGIK